MVSPRYLEDHLEIFSILLKNWDLEIFSILLTNFKQLTMKKIEVMCISNSRFGHPASQPQRFSQIPADILIEVAAVAVLQLPPLDILSYRPVEAEHFIIDFSGSGRRSCRGRWRGCSWPVRQISCRRFAGSGGFHRGTAVRVPAPLKDALQILVGHLFVLVFAKVY